jgi:hypothetical protein
MLLRSRATKRNDFAIPHDGFQVSHDLNVRTLPERILKQATFCPPYLFAIDFVFAHTLNADKPSHIVLNKLPNF